MTEFDAAGGPWGYRLRANATTLGIDLYIEANTFSNQPAPLLQGTIPDQTVYVGPMADGETYLQRHNWFNQGAQYRATVANYPGYPAVTVADYYHLQALRPFLTELVVLPGGSVDLGPLLPLLTNATLKANQYYYRLLLALLSGCAVTNAQRTQFATALNLNPGSTQILMNHGVLLYAYLGSFTTQDYAAIDTTLALFPEPVKDQLHVVVLDEGMPAFGGYASGGIVVLNEHASGAGGFAPYPGGGKVPDVTTHLQITLGHEIGHMCDSASVGMEAPRWEAIYASGASDPNAFLYGSVYPLPTEDIIFFWVSYCADSQTILNEVAGRGNAVLSQKLSHTIDMLPSLTPGSVPFFSTNPTTHVTTVASAPCTRGPSAYLGDDGMIMSVNGITF
jgi:hypothetical protein